MGEMTIRHGKATIRLSGLNELYAELQKVSPRAQDAGVSVLNSAAQSVFAKSQALVPVAPEDGGQLKASGRSYKARVSKRSGRVYATITYGGARLAALIKGLSPIYVIVQHEDLSLKHTHGAAKFLEKPFLEEKESVFAGLREKIRNAIKAN